MLFLLLASCPVSSLIERGVFGIPLLYFTEHWVHLWIFIDPVVVYVPRCVQNGSESLGLKALEVSMLELEAVPHS
jgi:hypothetical protein